MGRSRAIVVAAGLLAAGGAWGDAAGQIPQEFTNLSVLDEDISRGELVGIMRQYAGALGVRCNYCHLGDDPNDFTGYDFASDERDPKVVARGMMEMVDQINEHLLPAAGRGGDVVVGCKTCHGGVAIPMEIDDLLLRTVEEEGVDAAITEYRQLREEYYGRAAYDFGQGPVNTAAETLGRQEALEEALAVIRLNTREFHTEEPFPLVLEAGILMGMDDREGAIRALERAVELDPDSEFLRAQLERTRGAGNEAR